MISTTARPYIEASVPVLREHGLAIRTRFYARMFEAHPELRNLFNMGNQASGAQQQSLAAAVFAYAANIDNAAALTPVLDRIVHKHAAVGIKPSHYPIVGRHLLGAIGEVLGEAATPELIAAWDEAYWLLAGELIAAEARLYQHTGTQAGQLQPLQVLRTEREGADTVSLYLQTPQGTCAVGAGTADCVVGDVPNGGTVTLTFSGTVAPYGIDRPPIDASTTIRALSCRGNVYRWIAVFGPTVTSQRIPEPSVAA